MTTNLQAATTVTGAMVKAAMNVYDTSSWTRGDRMRAAIEAALAAAAASEGAADVRNALVSLECTAQWLEGGCDPKAASVELRGIMRMLQGERAQSSGGDASEREAFDKVRAALPEFQQQDDYLLAHGASLMSDDSHEIIHVETVARIIRAALATDAARPTQARDDTGRLTSDYEPTPHEIKVCRDAICREFGNNGTDGYYVRILKAIHGARDMLAAPDAAKGEAKPVAWVRRHPDNGELTGDFLFDDVIEPVRKQSGVWHPLVASPEVTADDARWQPIANAPKDRVILLWVPTFSVWVDGPWRGAWGHVADQWVIHSPFSAADGRAITVSDIPYPTHWMPLPTPPVDAALAAQNGEME